MKILPRAGDDMHVVATRTATGAVSRLLNVDVPPGAKHVDLRKLAHATWAMVMHGDAETLRRATMAVGTAGNVLLERRPGVLGPDEVIGTPDAIYGAFGVVGMMMEIGSQDALERRLAVEILTSDLRDVVRILAERDATGSELVGALGVNKSTISRRLGQLREMGLLHRVRGRGRGRNALTRLGARAWEHVTSMEQEDGLGRLRRELGRLLSGSTKKIDVQAIFAMKLEVEKTDPGVLEAVSWISPRRAGDV